MKLAVLLLLSFAMSIQIVSEDYESYLRSFDKFYESSDEYTIRYETYQKNMKKIAEHNSNPDRTWDMGVSHYTDWSWEEFQEKILGEPQKCSLVAHDFSQSNTNTTDYPTNLDWRTYGVVSPVKINGRCGSGWALSATDAIESHWSIFTKSTPQFLSEQQLIDCSGAFGNKGCNGGLPSQAFEYVKYAGGITTGEQYPSTQSTGKCDLSGKNFTAHIPYGSANVTAGHEDDMLMVMYGYGPLSIAYEVTEDFTHYSSGIYSSKNCNSTSAYVNHAVLGVGYGFMNGIDYWLLKNSWGTEWGMEGYFMIERGVNMCGLSECVSFPLVGPGN